MRAACPLITVRNAAGAVLLNAQFRVYIAGTSQLADIYYMPEGGDPVPQPAYVTNTGRVQFYVESGVYDIEIINGVETTLATDVRIGVAQAFDVGTTAGHLLTNADAEAKFLTVTVADSRYLTPATGDSRYLTPAAADSTYLTQTTADGRYLTQATADTRYLLPTDADARYLTPAAGDSRYLLPADAAATYLTQTDAANTYLTATTADTRYALSTYVDSTFLTRTDAATQYVAISGGNVLINTTTNDAVNKLQINQGATSGGIKLFTDAGIDAVLALRRGATEVAQFNGVFDGALINGSQVVRIATGGTERARMSASGNLLIGTTTDDGANKLQLNGSFAFIGTTHNLTTNSNAARLLFCGGSSLTNGGAIAIRGDTNGTSNPGGIELFGGGTERIRMTSAGNLLINTTATTGARLQVAGVGQFTSTGTITAGAGIEIGYDGTQGFLSSWNRATAVRLPTSIYGSTLDFYPNGAIAARFTSAGNLLIGTTTDDSLNKLQVAGSALITSKLLVGGPTEIWAAHHAEFVRSYDGINSVLVRNNTVGQGCRVIVQSNDTAMQLETFSTTYTSSGIRLAASALFQNNGSGGFYINAANSAGSIFFATGGSALSNVRATITSAGRLLIGTTTDNGVDILQLAGNINTTGQITSSGNQIAGNGSGSTYQLINGGTGADEKGVLVRAAGTNRWFAGGNSTAESGSNVGSDYILKRFSDTGAALGVPFTVTRATGTAIFDAAAEEIVRLSRGGGHIGLSFGRGASRRWMIYTNGTTAESAGTNVGSDFSIANYNDSGAYITMPFFIKRSTGNVLINTSTDDGTNKLQINGSLSVATGNTYKVNNVNVVGARRAGWATPTGVSTRTAFDTATVTTAQLAERVRALIEDLTAHGLIGA